MGGSGFATLNAGKGLDRRMIDLSQPMLATLISLDVGNLYDIDIIDRSIPRIPGEILMFGGGGDDLFVEFPQLQDTATQLGMELV